ncbi:DgyrCDS2251 [Dimorphilus gyrociliatus]|uniref:Mini-chromosome maintenance complex-binding protein n=1 Tax=Dimorphilus gyrociliatus TaxID=2664684 RepID=A0A7I8VCH2_9ANNE|nr:DgyrCDS2251 [Dimorphilus gyrociliatus]
MTDLEKYIVDPLSYISNLAAERKNVSQICDIFREKIQKGLSEMIPSLNETSQDSLKANSLIKYRGMVQDMFGEELFPEYFNVVDSSNTMKMKTGLLQDIYQFKDGERADFDTAQMAERQCYYFVPIPTENSWIKDYYKSKRLLEQPSSSNYDNRNKRNLESDDEDSNGFEQLSQLSGDENQFMDIGEVTESSKKMKTPKEEDKKSQIPFNLNFPIDTEKETPCIGVAYENYDDIKLNTVYEIYGILSNHPALAANTLNENGSASGFETDEMYAKSPPPSLVPRIHIVLIRKLENIDPSYQLILKESRLNDISLKLRDYLQQVLLGDRIAADYLFCYLMSRVYARKDSRAIGKFSLNLTNLNIQSQHTKYIYTALERILPLSLYCPLSLENMNKRRMTPYKDYKSNRLMSGSLQLPDGTRLILDETALQPGQLDTIGVQNTRSLNDVVCWQKLEYDFTYHKQEFFTDFPVLVFSEGKSVFQCDCRLPLKTIINPDNLESYYLQMMATQESNFQDFRNFISMMSFRDYTFPDDLKQEVEQYFVDMRKQDNKMTADAFLNLLLFARLLTLSRSETTLTADIWSCAKALEQERQRRIEA